VTRRCAPDRLNIASVVDRVYAPIRDADLERLAAACGEGAPRKSLLSS
jgi:hypothetical protein